MGGITSKSPLERRNTVARRSQRRTLHNLKSKIDRLYKDIKKFKGITQDVNYTAIKNEIEYFKNDLTRKSKDLQPQVRDLYENVYKRVSEAEEALNNKLQENIERYEKKDVKQRENGDAATSVFSQSEVMSDVASMVADNETVVDVHQGEYLDNGDQKKKVEMTGVIVQPYEASSPKQVRIVSPSDQKRKSILKVGVPVMPGAMMNELAAHNNRVTRQQEQAVNPAARTIQDVLDHINQIVASLRKIEDDISGFIGKKNGRQYLQIREYLNSYSAELDTLAPVDDYALEQIRICKNFILSNSNFLDEKASNDGAESFTSDDEVFLNNNVPYANKVEDYRKKQSLLKNTAV